MKEDICKAIDFAINKTNKRYSELFESSDIVSVLEREWVELLNLDNVENNDFNRKNTISYINEYIDINKQEAMKYALSKFMEYGNGNDLWWIDLFPIFYEKKYRLNDVNERVFSYLSDYHMLKTIFIKSHGILSSLYLNKNKEACLGLIVLSFILHDDILDKKLLVNYLSSSSPFEKLSQEGHVPSVYLSLTSSNKFTNKKPLQNFTLFLLQNWRMKIGDSFNSALLEHGNKETSLMYCIHQLFKINGDITPIVKNFNDLILILSAGKTVNQIGFNRGLSKGLISTVTLPEYAMMRLSYHGL